MALTQRQKKAVNSANGNTKRILISSFRKQNSLSKSNNKSGVRKPYRNVPTFSKFKSPNLNRFQSRTGLPVMSNRFKTRKVFAPNTLGFNLENQQQTSLTITRTCLVAQSMWRSGSNIYNANRIDIHPGSIPWLKDICKLYDKYMFKSYQVRVLPAVGANTNGMGFIGFNYENHHTIANNLQTAQAYDKFCITPIWAESDWVSVANNILTDKWYDCTFNDSSEMPTAPPSGDSFHDYSPGRLVFGHSGVTSFSDRDRLLFSVELRFSIVLSRPTAPTALMTSSVKNFCYLSNDEEVEEVNGFISIRPKLKLKEDDALVSDSSDEESDSVDKISVINKRLDYLTDLLSKLTVSDYVKV